ncbi:hypothetical protein Aph01nite_08320 [Acrocarpospora phusangensis]|uniref:4Fe-4S Wbl-type domain-containing protein n=1 Tax=Acrocarpospora phusangensis TaxID=1070424 RepID=A0A919Q579_9ACTN|nr:WhiB family transcriptional regulator [Acrocarpospora phusangensis]GIH22522.1 hypothetical protein Aph01nite_08320 [Acrocarpospora phusangensis]
MTLLQLPRTIAPPNTLSDLNELRLTVMAYGTCRGTTNPDAWFPDEPDWEDDSQEATEARGTHKQTARMLCGGCPVRAECLEAALAEEQLLPRSAIHGIRGARSAWERLKLRRSRQRSATRQTRKAA